MMRYSRIRLLGLLLGGLSVGILTIVVVASDWSGDQTETVDGLSENKSSDRNRALPILTMRLGELSAPARQDDYRGILQPSKLAELAFRRSGKIREIFVEEGTSVMVGQCLAELETADVRARVQGTEARIREARATLAELEAGPRRQTIAAAKAEVRRLEALAKLAEANLQRERELQKAKSSSARAFDSALYTSQQQTAALETAKQQLEELLAGTRSEQIEAQRARVATLEAEQQGYLVDLEDSRITAPFSGVISRRYVDEGGIAGPETMVLRLLKIDPLEAKFGLTPEDAASLAIGQEFSITMGKIAIRGFVSNVEPEVDLATRTQAVLFSIPRQRDVKSNSRSSNRPATTNRFSESDFAKGNAMANVVAGRTVSLSLGRLREGGKDAYWVPLTALSKSTRGLWSLFAVQQTATGHHEVVRREVQVQETDTRLARITGGMIHQGDMVVADGTHRLAPGMRVDPVSDNSVAREASR